MDTSNNEQQNKNKFINVNTDEIDPETLINNNSNSENEEISNDDNTYISKNNNSTDLVDTYTNFSHGVDEYENSSFENQIKNSKDIKFDNQGSTTLPNIQEINQATIANQNLNNTMNLNPMVNQNLNNTMNLNPMVNQNLNNTMNLNPMVNQNLNNTMNLNPMVNQNLNNTMNLNPMVNQNLNNTMNLNPMVNQNLNNTMNLNPTVSQNLETKPNVREPNPPGTNAFDKKVKKASIGSNIMLMFMYALIIGAVGYVVYALWFDKSAFYFKESKLNIMSGATYQEEVYVKGKIDNKEDYIWSSENNDVASVDGNGLITANNEGTVNIVVTNKKTKKSNTIAVKVVNLEIKEFTVKPKEKVVFLGSTYKVTPIVNGQTSVIINYTFESADESIATVNDEGEIKGVKEGKTTVTIRIPNTKYKTVLNVVVRIKS